MQSPDTSDTANHERPFVSVIIPVFNDYDRLALCLSALATQSYPQERYEVLVIDNGSAAVPSPPLPPDSNAVWLQQTKPGSYAARNLGLRHAKGTILAFTDSDCIPAGDWIEEGVAALDHLKGPGYVGGRIDVFPLDENSPTPTELFEMATAFQVESSLKELHYAPTANVFVRRQVIEDVGPFEEQLQSGGDAEFGRRVFAAGYQQFYASGVVVRHPARHSLQEQLTKLYRVTAGGLALADMGDTNARIQFESLSRQLKPPVRSLYRIFKSPRLPAIGDKAKAAAVKVTLHYAAAWETVRITRLGRKPRGKRS